MPNQGTIDPRCENCDRENAIKPDALIANVGEDGKCHYRASDLLRFELQLTPHDWVNYHSAATADCRTHLVDWRERALKAEAALENVHKELKKQSVRQLHGLLSN
jgi:hypothetical protein